jgi:sulfite exporter TauE/SafE
MCGPLAAYACSGRPGAAGQGRYQLGRFVSYSVLGAIAGTVGGATAVSLPHAWGSALLSWSLALGLGLVALRLWRRPNQPLVTLRTKQDDATPSFGSRVLGGLGRHPFFVGLGTALLPCGALAAAVLIAASTGSTTVVGATWVFERFARRPNLATSRILAVVLALGSVLFVIRPVHALRTGDTSSCHAPAHDHGDHEAHQQHPLSQ